MYKIYFVCYFIIIINFSKSEKLIFASLHSRHGARAPLDCNENNLDFLGEKWTNPGQLTPTGQRMEYILGLRNNQRYIKGKPYKFLSEKFDPHEILVYSTDVNRTILSISSQLQGLYPMSSKAGYTLNEEQIKVSNPPVNINSYEDIQKEIENLNISSLPNFMTIIPIHTLTTSERKMNVQDSVGCKEKVNKTRDNNKISIQTIINAAEKFNSKYSKNLNNYYDQNPSNFTYDFDWIGLFCDTMVSDISDGRKMTDFFSRTGIDKDELEKDCREVIEINFRDDFYGDEKNQVSSLVESNLIKDILYYMNLKIDEDKNNEIQGKNVSDYSKPKMTIYSGHDSTLSGEEMFMIRNFGLKDTDFIYPTYTTQFAFEVTRNDEKPDKIEYTDYTVKFYINDKLFISRNFQEFKDIILEKAWSSKQINEFCEIKEEEEDEDEDDANSIEIYIIIGLAVLSLILVIVVIFLVKKLIKLNKKENENEDNERKESSLLDEEEN